jgi:hypothetical protein
MTIKEQLRINLKFRAKTEKNLFENVNIEKCRRKFRNDEVTRRTQIKKLRKKLKSFQENRKCVTHRFATESSENRILNRGVDKTISYNA